PDARAHLLDNTCFKRKVAVEWDVVIVGHGVLFSHEAKRRPILCRHTARKRGIQYSETVVSLDRPAFTGSSAFADDDSGDDPYTRVLALEKRLDAGDGAAEDQRVDVMSALVGVDRLEVRGVAHHVILDL